MQQSILLIGNTHSKSALRLQEEATHRGVVFDGITSKALTLQDEAVQVAAGTVLSKDFFAYDTYLFRGVHTTQRKRMQELAAWLFAHGKRVVERRFAVGGLPNDKCVPPSQQGLYRVPYYCTVSPAQVPDMLATFTLPVVVKELQSSMGRGVQMCETVADVQAFADRVGGLFLLQEYLPIEYDIRLLVVGGKVLGGFTRHKKDGEEFLTTAPGGKRVPITPTDIQICAAQEACALQDIEIAGVDLCMYDDVPYIIEVNTAPQFRVFEQCTGINAAKQIIAYIV